MVGRNKLVLCPGEIWRLLKVAINLERLPGDGVEVRNVVWCSSSGTFEVTVEAEPNAEKRPE